MPTAVSSGITGQDGSFLAELLLEKGYRVVGIRRRNSTDNTQNISHLLDNPNLILVHGDVTDYSSLYRIFKEYKPDEIYNLAAQSHVRLSFDEPINTTQIDYIGCLNFLEIIRNLKSDNYNPRFYQASSSEMYGDQYDRFIDGSKYQDENTKLNPQSPYAISKVAAHHAVRLYRESYGIFACSGILFNHESERRGENFVTRKITKYIGELINWAKSKSIDPIPKLRLGNLSAKRDWGHSKDYCRAMWMMLQQDKPDDFVIATGETHSVQEFLEEAFSSVSLNWKDFVVIDENLFRPSEVPILRGYPQKAKEVLGWEPQIKFKELVKLMVDSDINNVL